jgi:hypothetical protein
MKIRFSFSFVCCSSSIFFVKEAKKESGAVPLPGYIVEPADAATSKLHSFRLYDPQNLKKKQFYIHADNAQDLDGWTKSIEVCFLRICCSSFCLLLLSQLKGGFQRVSRSLCERLPLFGLPSLFFISLL